MVRTSGATRSEGTRRWAAVLTLALTLGTVAVTASSASAAPRGTDHACPPGEIPDPGFTDAAGPFADAIACVAWYGITQGRTASSFAPGGTVTRGQLASFTRALLDAADPDGFPLGDTDTGFTDVPSDSPHARAIDALASADPPVLLGYTATRFGPTDRVNRAQAASMVDRALTRVLPDLAAGSDAACRFTDADRIDRVHRDAVQRLCALGVVAGRNDGSFGPTAGILRGQAAAFLARAMDVVAVEGDLADPWQVTTVVSGLTQPWDVVVAGDDLYVSERDSGRLLEVTDDGAVDLVRTFEVNAQGEGGLLGLAADPDGVHLVAYLTTGSDNRVVRFDPADGDAGDLDVLLDGIPRANTHNGGRLAFGPDGMLYIGTGDAEATSLAPDPSSLAGKVLRIGPDGTLPDDNPFRSPVWSVGHRNVQGLTFDRAGRLWASEFGPGVDDEVNVILPGRDYGWPTVTGVAGDDRFEDPAIVKQPPEASWSGAAITTEHVGFAGPDTLLVAALRGQRLWAFSLDDGQVTGERELFEGDFGRLRTVVPTGDGGVFLLTGNGGDDRLLRVGRTPR
ncbi:hypothetical protein FTX61_02120 [Nitriliruptoraceae bacterium ZYF776]|nr:hypothetical protein [Profundirhabdus halotolerans]